uniref:Uncharacterized protein n=1 Tax=Panagrolaimus davidi TaxID=227884 RepID=A0A914Q9S5_9BILA
MFPEVIIASSDSRYIPNVEKDFHNRIKRAFGTISTLIPGSEISENVKLQILKEGTSEDAVEQIIPEFLGGSGAHKNNCFPVAKNNFPLSNEWKNLKIDDGYCIQFEYIFYYDNCCKTHKRPIKINWILKNFKDTVCNFVC